MPSRNSLLDMMGAGSYSPNVIPIPGESGSQVNLNPANYAVMGSIYDTSYNPSGTYSGTPMQLAPGFQYRGGFSGGGSSGDRKGGIRGDTSGATSGGSDVFNESQGPGWLKPYQSRDTSTGGGYFTLMDMFSGGGGKPTDGTPPRGGRLSMEDYVKNRLPNQFQAGADQPSTNNWRLIPNPEYRKPGYIVRNGRVINTQLAGNDYGGGQPAWGEAGTDLGGMSRIQLGSGAAYGVPASGYKNVFWPGQVGRATPIGGGQWE